MTAIKFPDSSSLLFHYLHWDESVEEVSEVVCEPVRHWQSLGNSSATNGLQVLTLNKAGIILL